MSRFATDAPEGDPDPYRGRPLGRVLIKCGKVTRQQVHEALAEQAERTKSGVRVPIGQLLVEKGLCTAADVEMALRLQRGLPPIPPANRN